MEIYMYTFKVSILEEVLSVLSQNATIDPVLHLNDTRDKVTIHIRYNNKAALKSYHEWINGIVSREAEEERRRSGREIERQQRFRAQQRERIHAESLRQLEEAARLAHDYAYTQRAGLNSVYGRYDAPSTVTSSDLGVLSNVPNGILTNGSWTIEPASSQPFPFEFFNQSDHNIEINVEDTNG